MKQHARWTDGERRALEALGRAIELVGAARFRRMKLLSPSDDLAAEADRADVIGLERVFTTLLSDVGLAHVKVVVSDDPDDVGEPPADHAIWLASRDDDLFMFGAHWAGLDDVLGAASHAVAHAYLETKLAAADVPTGYRDAPAETKARDDDELLTSAVEVALGFGMLSAEHVLVRTRNPNMKHAPVTTTPRRGHATPESIAFLFGAQLVARAVGYMDRLALLSDLRDDPRALVREQVRRLEPDRELLLEALHLSSGP